VMKIKIAVFWVLTPCSDVVGYQHFGGPCCSHLQSKVVVKAAWSSEMLVCHHITTWHQNSEDHNLDLVISYINTRLCKYF